MSKPSPVLAAPRRQLSLLDSTCIIVGVIIGSGIYETTPIIANNVSDWQSLIYVWLMGGAISLLGAMCYAELSTAFPHAGGDYIFLSRAFGKRAGFFFAWAEFWIIRPGNVGMMAFVFARYANRLIPLDLDQSLSQVAFILYACAAVVLLTGINLMGVRVGKTVQNILTIGKVLGLAMICVVGLTAGSSSGPIEPQVATDSSSNLRLAMILVLFTYGGWNEMSYVAAEVRNPQRNILRALFIGTLAVTTIYLVANIAFLRALGLNGMRTTNALAADVLQLRFGEWGAKAMSICVCLSCLGAINGMVFTGSRIYYALGTEHPWFAWLGKWNGRLDSPVRSLMVQSSATIALIIAFGSYQNDKQSGFDRLLNFTAPVFWFFIFMVGISVFVLRLKRAPDAIGYRVIGYPFTAVFFCLLCAFLFDASLSYAIENRSREAIWAISILGAGIFIIFRRIGAETAHVGHDFIVPSK